MFQQPAQLGSSEVLLTGYEVKGFERKTERPPPFAEGLDQALVLLQGADFAYLVHPEPETEEDKRALRELCDRFSPSVGLIFLHHDLEGLGVLSLLPYRNAVQNYHTHRDRKRSMLSSVITGGLRDEVSNIPLWCKRL